MKRYVGQRSRKSNRAYVFVIRVDGDSQRLKRHPNLCDYQVPFEWGYDGPGPAQLAFEMLYDATGDAALAHKVHLVFMKEIIITFKGVRSWSIGEADVLKAAIHLAKEMEGKKAK